MEEVFAKYEKLVEDYQRTIEELKNSMNSLLEGFYDIKKERKKINLEDQFSVINIPSKGIFYPDKKKSFLVKYLTAKEEHVLTDSFLMESGRGIEMVLESVILDDFMVRGLLLSDYQAIMMFLRSTAYGDNIDTEVVCPHCLKKNEHSFPLVAIEFQQPEVLPNDDGFYEVSLDGLGLELKIRPLTLEDTIKELEETGKDDYIIYKNSEIDLKIKKESTLNLVRQIREINGDSNKENIKKVVQRLPRKYITQLRDFVKKNQISANDSISYECPYCMQESTQKINMGYDFLKLPSEYKEKIVLEEMFLITYYGKTISRSDALQMPVYERKWWLRKIKETIDAKNQAEKRAYNNAKSSKGKH